MAAASLIVYNAKVLTMDGAGKVAEALWCQDGRIAAVGSDDEIRSMSGPSTRVVDAEGAVVLPGLIDVHTHLELLAYTTELAVDYRAPHVKNIGGIISRLREKAATVPEGEWILGQGSHFQDALLDEKRYPDRYDLDKATTRHPVLARFSGHVQIFNSLGLEKVGLTRDTPDPRGGRMERDENGELTGRTHDLGLTTNTAIDIPQWPFPVIRDSILKVARERYAANGVTTLGDIQLQRQGFPALVDLHRSGELPVRIRAYMNHPTVLSRNDAIERKLSVPLDGVDPAWIRWIGVKLFMDGGITSANAALYEPYVHEPLNRGVLSYEQGELTELVHDLDAAGHQVIIHCIGDRAIDTCLNAFEALPTRRTENQAPHRLEHAGMLFMNPQRIAQFKRAGVLPVPQPGFIYSVGDAPRKYLGENRAAHSFPFRTLLQEGLAIPGSSDAGGADPRMSSPFFGLWCLVCRETHEGRRLDENESLTVEQGLRMYTVNAAAALGESENLGSIEVGKLADFLLVDRDPREVPPEELMELKARATWIGGELAYGEARELSLSR